MPPKKNSTKKGQRKVAKVMKEWKEGTLKSGMSHKKVASQKQAVAIALSEARKVDPTVKPNPHKK